MIETVTKRFLKLIIAFAMVITSFTAPTKTVRAEDEVPGSKIQLNGDEELTPADKNLKKIKSYRKLNHLFTISHFNIFKIFKYIFKRFNKIKKF